MIANRLRRWKRRRLLEKVHAGRMTINEARGRLDLPAFDQGVADTPFLNELVNADAIPELPPPTPEMMRDYQTHSPRQGGITDSEDITDCHYVHLYDDGGHRVWHTINGDPWVEGPRPGTEVMVEHMIAYWRSDLTSDETGWDE